jgi:hypothetical protein
MREEITLLKVWNNNKALFHMPKTAGSSVTRVFEQHWGKAVVRISEPSDQHHTLQEVRDVYDIDIDGLEIYTIIRNPYQCAVSLYAYVRGGNKEAKSRRIKNKAKTLAIHNLKFPEYIDWYCENWLSYKDWLFVDDVLPENVIIWKTETISKDLKEFFGRKTKVPHLNKSKSKNYSEYFNKTLYDKINKKYKWCFDQGFYKME